jgi:hypothetical protein
MLFDLYPERMLFSTAEQRETTYLTKILGHQVVDSGLAFCKNRSSFGVFDFLYAIFVILCPPKLVLVDECLSTELILVRHETAFF